MLSIFLLHDVVIKLLIPKSIPIPSDGFSFRIIFWFSSVVTARKYLLAFLEIVPNKILLFVGI
jgi:hypothetical protein